jgi:hypothetical protein
MADPAVADLAARVAVLEAAVRTGCASAPISTEVAYPFLAALAGDDLLSAQALVQEVLSLRAKVEKQETEIEQLNYRIHHMRENLGRLIPPV